MPVVTLWNLPEETYRALELRAVQHGRSIEAESQAILEEAVLPGAHVKVGSEFAAFGRRLRDVELDTTRDSTPTEPAIFE